MSEIKDPVLEAILKQYEDNAAKANKKTTSTAFDAKHYFTTFIEKTKKEGKKTIRLLEPKDGGSIFEEVYVHSKKGADGQNKKYICLEQQLGQSCPFCEARKLLLKEGTDATKEEAKQYNFRKTYIVRLIDRDHEEDGVKFWRINEDYTGKGNYNKIMDLINLKGNVAHPVTGRDLIINIGRDQKGNPSVTSILQDDITPLSIDQELADSWINDGKKWSDVYKAKTYDFLFIIALGGEPVFSKELNKYVDKATLSDDNTKEEDSTKFAGFKDKESATETIPKVETTKSAPVIKAKPISEVADVEDEEEQLPF